MPEKTPVIAIMDDELGNPGNTYSDVRKTIGKIAAALGYDPQTILDHVRPFPTIASAESFIRAIPSGQEEPLLAFIDDQFKEKYGNRNYGPQLVDSIRKAAPQTRIVWASSMLRSPEHMRAMDIIHDKPGTCNRIKDELGYFLVHSQRISALASADRNAVKDDDYARVVLVQELKHAFEAIEAHRSQTVGREAMPSHVEMARRQTPQTPIDQANLPPQNPGESSFHR